MKIVEEEEEFGGKMKAVSGYFLKINSFLFFINSQNHQRHKKFVLFLEICCMLGARGDG